MRQYANFINRIELFQTESLPIKYMIAIGAGIIVGFKVISPNTLAFFYLFLLALCFVQCLKKNIGGFFSLLPYLLYTEVFLRKKVFWVPYFTLQYFFIATFAIFILSGLRGKTSHFKAMPILMLYAAVEIIDNIYPNNVTISRAIITQTLALLIPAIWASYTKLSNEHILKLLMHLKIAGVYLTGIVIVAHITGGIDYGHQSSTAASNGLAPVQLSGYLGLTSVLFFFSLMNIEESHQQWMNAFVLGLVVIIMALTFSRGGIYFIVSIIAAYFFYNRSKMGNYFKFLILVPMAAIIYYSLVQTTGGKILERYELEGTSGRDELIKVAFDIFSTHLVTGIGTGNFNTEIFKQHMYGVESGAHNEFARVAAEHGIIGLFLYWGFFLLLFLNILKRKEPQRQFAMYFFILFCLITVHNGLKISIQPILLMLAIGISGKAYRKKLFNAPQLSAKSLA